MTSHVTCVIVFVILQLNIITNKQQRIFHLFLWILVIYCNIIWWWWLWLWCIESVAEYPASSAWRRRAECVGKEHTDVGQVCDFAARWRQSTLDADVAACHWHQGWNSVSICFWLSSFDFSDHRHIALQL